MKTVIIIILLAVSLCSAATFTCDPNDITTKDEIVTIPCTITMTADEYLAMQDIGKKPTDIVDIARVIKRWIGMAIEKLIDPTDSYRELKAKVTEQE